MGFGFRDYEIMGHRCTFWVFSCSDILPLLSSVFHRGRCGTLSSHSTNVCVTSCEYTSLCDKRRTSLTIDVCKITEPRCIFYVSSSLRLKVLIFVLLMPTLDSPSEVRPWFDMLFRSSYIEHNFKIFRSGMPHIGNDFFRIQHFKLVPSDCDPRWILLSRESAPESAFWSLAGRSAVPKCSWCSFSRC
jgi:hypothetical protein